MLHYYGSQDTDIHFPETIANASFVLCNCVREIDALVKAWHENKQKTRLEPVGGES